MAVTLQMGKDVNENEPQLAGVILVAALMRWW